MLTNNATYEAFILLHTYKYASIQVENKWNYAMFASHY